MTVLKIAKDIVVDTWDFPHDADTEIGAKVVVEKVIGADRWEETRQIICTLPGYEGLWMAYYRAGLTEYQYVAPWENDEEVIFTECERFEKTVVDYRIKVDKAVEVE